MTSEKKMKLLLVGGGHAHVHLIKKIRKTKNAFYDVTVISKGERQYYSGMASGYLEGLYEETDIYFDLESLCDSAGIDFFCDEVIRVDKDKKIIETSNGMIMKYDVISFDIGSDLAGREIDGVDNFSHKIKPLGNLKEIRSICETMLQNSAKIVIVGTGAAGMEIALAIKNLSDKKNKKYNITMIGSSNEVLKGYDQKMKILGLNVLEKSKINLVMNERVKTVDPLK
ncbi:MAG: FAD-dependent oxidoreductase, partial [Bacillota bacterium]|nr:FAD-dependent oxidoreductase [Bacillota bacterium]